MANNCEARRLLSRRKREMAACRDVYRKPRTPHAGLLRGSIILLKLSGKKNILFLSVSLPSSHLLRAGTKGA